MDPFTAGVPNPRAVTHYWTLARSEWAEEMVGEYARVQSICAHMPAAHANEAADE